MGWNYNCTILGTKILDLIILSNTLNNVSYMQFLTENLPNFLEELLLNRNNIIFQQDGPYNARIVTII